MSDPDVNERTTAATPNEVVQIQAPKHVTGYEEGNDHIAARIDAAIADDDMYELGDPRPSPEAAAKAKDLDVNERTTAATPHEVVQIQAPKQVTGYEEGNDHIAARIDAAFFV